MGTDGWYLDDVYCESLSSGGIRNFFSFSGVSYTYAKKEMVYLVRKHRVFFCDIRFTLACDYMEKSDHG